MAQMYGNYENSPGPRRGTIEYWEIRKGWSLIREGREREREKERKATTHAKASMGLPFSLSTTNRFVNVLRPLLQCGSLGLPFCIYLLYIRRSSVFSGLFCFPLGPTRMIDISGWQFGLGGTKASDIYNIYKNQNKKKLLLDINNFFFI